jgi:hypothetical protein
MENIALPEPHVSMVFWRPFLIRSIREIVNASMRAALTLSLHTQAADLLLKSPRLTPDIRRWLVFSQLNIDRMSQEVCRPSRSTAPVFLPTRAIVGPNSDIGGPLEFREPGPIRTALCMIAGRFWSKREGRLTAGLPSLPRLKQRAQRSFANCANP